MGKRKDEKIKVIIANPERLPYAKEKLMKFLYDEYMRKASSEDTEKIAK
jgi:hypothetical protein